MRCLSTLGLACPLRLIGGEREGEAEMQRAIDQLAELVLLGAGDADRLFPDSLEEMYEAYADETQWRVML